MKKIDRLLLSSFVPPFIASFFIAMFVLLMQTLWLYIDDIAGKGLGIFLVVELLAYKCVALIPLALPIAILISSVMLMGNLAEHYELSSFKSAGVSLIRIMRPIMGVGVLTALFAYYCGNYLMPIANLNFGSRMYDIQRQKPALRLDAGVFNYDFQGFAIHIGQKGTDGRAISDVLIYDHSNQNNNEFSQILAERGEMYATEDGRYFIMNLHEGHQYIETRPGSSGGDSYPFVRTSFRNWTKIFDLGEFQLNQTDKNLFKSNRSMLTIPQLYEAVDSLDVKILEREKNFSNLVSNYFHGMELDSTFLEPARRDSSMMEGYSSDQKDTISQDSPVKKEQAKPVEQVAKAPDPPTQEVQKVQTSSIEQRGREQEKVRELPVNSSLPINKINKKKNLQKPPDDKIPDVDTVQHFANAFTNLPVYERKRLYSKAKTFARSIEQQSEAAIRFLDDLTESRVKHLYDLHMKYSMAVVCFVFVFIGGPMGAIIRKGGFGYPILISIFFFTLFVILTIFCRKIAESMILPATWAAWVPIAILMPVGVILTVRAMNDSKMLDIDKYTQFLTKLFKKKKAA